MPRDTYDMFKEPERGRFGENEERRDRFAHDRESADIVLAMIFHGESGQAVRVSQNGDAVRAIWLPKSLIKMEMRGSPYKDRNGKQAQGCNITLSEWKAKQENLI